MLLFVFDVLVFLALPYLCWRVLRGTVPMAVMPILTGLLIAVAAYNFGFDKSVIGPSKLGETIGWLGVLVLTFSAGLDTRTMAQDQKLGPHFFVSATSALALPFTIGVLLALSGLLDGVIAAPDGVAPSLSAAALGLCVAVSALPVLVGVVRELPPEDRATGNVALRIAALDDAILWSGLAILLFLHARQADLIVMNWRTFAASGVFVVLALLQRGLNKVESPHWAVAVLLGAIYLAAGAWATTTLGLHELLGAYFAGALMPATFAKRINPELVGKFALFGFSPLFFGHRGLSIDGSVVTASALGVALVLLVISAASKLFALHFAPPEPAMPARERTRLGLLLQCKGLMEIVAASILFQNHLISATTFAILVTLAIVSTTITIPLFRMASRAFARKSASI